MLSSLHISAKRQQETANHFRSPHPMVSKNQTPAWYSFQVRWNVSFSKGHKRLSPTSIDRKIDWRKKQDNIHIYNAKLPWSRLVAKQQLPNLKRESRLIEIYLMLLLNIGVAPKQFTFPSAVATQVRCPNLCRTHVDHRWSSLYIK